MRRASLFVPRAPGQGQGFTVEGERPPAAAPESSWVPSATAPSSETLRRTFAASPWGPTFAGWFDDFHASTAGGAGLQQGKPLYPSEPGIVFLSAFLATGEERYLEAAKAQLAFAHQRQTPEGLLAVDLGGGRLGVGKDPQSRQVYNFFTAFKLLGDDTYLAWADECAAALLRHVPQVEHTCRGLSLRTLEHGYRDPVSHRSIDAAPLVDPNQNAEAALALSLLYFEPRSAHYHSPSLRLLVAAEMEAGLCLVDGSGAVPLTEHPHRVEQMDTAYGAYALFSWSWVSRLWRDEAWGGAVRRSAEWLAGFSGPEGPTADRYYPGRGSYLASWDLWYRVPGLVDAGYDPKPLIERYVQESAPTSTPADRAFLLFAYFQLMGIPPDAYLGGPPAT